MRKRRHSVRKRRYWLLAVYVAVALFCLWMLLSFQSLVAVAKLIFHQNPALQQTDGRTNILLLGTGGANHDGPNLTDTIIFASIDQTANKVTLVSIPRDLWVVNGQTEEKINEAYADGQDNNNRGLIYAKAVVGKVVGQPIHYAFRIDFGGFVKSVDEIGGIDVNVPETLDDYNYPIEGKEDDSCGHAPDEMKQFSATDSAEMDAWKFYACRYMHVHVDKGLQHMDGTTALEYVRSRHGVGDQGTDFARSRRQQQVIEAFRSKVLSAGILLNPSKIVALYTILKDSIDTDITQDDFGPFIALAQKLKSAKIQSVVIDYGDAVTGRAGLVEQGPVDSAHNFAYTLIPRVGDQNFSEIRWFVLCELQKGSCTVPATPVSLTPASSQ